MRLGFTLPPPAATSHRELPQLIECIVSEGYDHVIVLDHVLGADRETRPDWNGPYSLDDPFYEPMTVLSYVAAISPLELVSGVLVLPQRQTALVAKQAAELQNLSGGRLRLGVGIGWNPVEYDALGMQFETRGARLGEQIDVLRRLLSQRCVTVDSRDHHIVAAGLNPLPRRIPEIWLGGGHAPVAAARIGRLADGWMVPAVTPGRGFEPIRDRILEARADAGRPTDSFPMEAGVLLADPAEVDEVRRATDRWLDAGVSTIQVITGKAARSPEDTMRLAAAAARVLRSE